MRARNIHSNLQVTKVVTKWTQKLCGWPFAVVEAGFAHFRFCICICITCTFALHLHTFLVSRPFAFRFAHLHIFFFFFLCLTPAIHPSPQYRFQLDWPKVAGERRGCSPLPGSDEKKADKMLTQKDGSEMRSGQFYRSSGLLLSSCVSLSLLSLFSSSPHPLCPFLSRACAVRCSSYDQKFRGTLMIKTTKATKAKQTTS